MWHHDQGAAGEDYRRVGGGCVKEGCARRRGRSVAGGIMHPLNNNKEGNGSILLIKRPDVKKKGGNTKASHQTKKYSPGRHHGNGEKCGGKMEKSGRDLLKRVIFVERGTRRLHGTDDRKKGWCGGEDCGVSGGKGRQERKLIRCNSCPMRNKVPQDVVKKNNSGLGLKTASNTDAQRKTMKKHIAHRRKMASRFMGHISLIDQGIAWAGH